MILILTGGINMPLPNKHVTIAIIDSYFNIRKDKWGLSIENFEKADLKEVENNKRQSCFDLVRAINKAETLENWRNFLYKISMEILVEQENVKLSEQSYFGFRSYFMDRPLFLETLSAVRAYCISQLELHPAFEAMKDNLIKEVSSAKDEEVKKDLVMKLAHLGSIRGFEEVATGNPRDGVTIQISYYFQRKYHLLHNKEITMVRDALAKELKEESFADFETNVLQGKRTAEICKKFLEGESKLAAMVAEIKKRDEKAYEVKASVAEVKPTISYAAIAGKLSPPAKLPPLENAPVLKIDSKEAKAETKVEPKVEPKPEPKAVSPTPEKSTIVKLPKVSPVSFVVPSARPTRRATRFQAKIAEEESKSQYSF